MINKKIVIKIFVSIIIVLPTLLIPHYYMNDIFGSQYVTGMEYFMRWIWGAGMMIIIWILIYALWRLFVCFLNDEE